MRLFGMSGIIYGVERCTVHVHAVHFRAQLLGPQLGFAPGPSKMNRDRGKGGFALPQQTFLGATSVCQRPRAGQFASFTWIIYHLAFS
jgi:hypothetical protein